MILVFARLFKIKISALAAAAAGTGYIMALQGITPGVLAPALGVFLAACGSSALNQVQERQADSAMLRTRGRPLPSGALTGRTALALAAVTIAAGLGLLLAVDVLACGLTAGAVLWYNAVYTYLKRITPFAAVPGGLVGAIPPAAGWAAAGGALLRPEILSLMLFMFVWQVPHFWLLLMKHSKDYERAGLPAVTNTFSDAQLRRIVFIWILAAAVSCLIVPVIGGGGRLAAPVLFAMAALWLVPHAARHLSRDGSSAAAVYVRLNVFALIVLSSLSAGAILSGTS
jgi:protoheme IX farnesyltransferase